MRTIHFPVYIVNQYERGIVECLGKYKRFVEPGLHLQWPVFNLTRVRDIREHTVSLDPQPVITKDNVEITVDDKGALEGVKIGNENFSETPGLGAKALAWAKANDQRLIDEVVALHGSQVLQVAAEDRSACGAGAIAAAIACAQALGATAGRLLHHTTSHDAQPMGQPSDFVGYAAIAFLA